MGFARISVQLLSHGKVILSQIRSTSVTRPLLLVLVDDVVDDSVFLALLGVHDEVALHVALDLLQELTAVLG